MTEIRCRYCGGKLEVEYQECQMALWGDPNRTMKYDKARYTCTCGAKATALNGGPLAWEPPQEPPAAERG